MAAFSVPAHATPVTVMFNGIDGFGVSEADALAASIAFGIPIVTPDFAGSAQDILDIAFQDLDETSITPFPPTGPGPHTATSHWAMENISAEDLLGSTLMLFTTVDPFDMGSMTIEYPDEMVGLTIDADLGWLFVQLSDTQGQNFYYPALDLGSLDSGEITDVFLVNYYVDGEIEQVGVTYILPKLRYGFGFTPIPEPGTITLLGLGLTGLALSRRRRRA